MSFFHALLLTIVGIGGVTASVAAAVAVALGDDSTASDDNAPAAA